MVEGEAPLVREGVGLADSVEVAESVVEGVPLGVEDEVTVPLGVFVGELPWESEAVGESDCEGVGVGTAVQEGDWEGVRVGVAVQEWYRKMYANSTKVGMPCAEW